MKKYLLPLLLFFPYITNACVDSSLKEPILTVIIKLIMFFALCLFLSVVSYEVIKWILKLLKIKENRFIIWWNYLIFLLIYINLLVLVIIDRSYWC